MDGIAGYDPHTSPYKARSGMTSHSEIIADNASEASSYVNGSHEDVLWSFEQQVNTMRKYGVVANSVEFEELEKSLDEELRRYDMYDELMTVKVTDDTEHMNESEVVHNGSISDSPPSSPDDVLLKPSSDIDRLYNQLYRDTSHTDHVIYRAPSDLDYYPTKQTPKVYPKSPKPAPKSYGASSSALITSQSSSRLNSHTLDGEEGYHDHPPGHGTHYDKGGRVRSGSGAAPSSGGGSQANIYNNGGAASLTSDTGGRYPPRRSSDSPPPLPPPPGIKPNYKPMPHGAHRKIVNTETEHFFGSTSSVLLGASAVSPPLQMPATRGYASSMPVLDTDTFEPRKEYYNQLPSNSVADTKKLATSRTLSNATSNSNSLTSQHFKTSQLMTSQSVMTSQNNMTSRTSLNRRSFRKCPDSLSAGSSSNNSEPELRDIIHILSTSSNLSLINTAAGALQHLSYNQDDMKKKIREAGAIPILIHMLSLDDIVCISSLGVLRNLSYGRNNHANRIAIQDAHGITLLVQLLNTTESYEIQELVTGVFWNLSSSDSLKLPILKQALESIIKNIIIPQSGWKESQTGFSFDHIHYANSNISWTTVFRNATGCLKNLSSAGIEGRTLLRMCHGLVDSLLWTVRSAQGKNDVDNKAVENAVCILRNLSYRLEAEVAPEVKYGCSDDWRSRGLGGGQFRKKGVAEESKKKKNKGKEVNVTPLPEHTSGVGLLWQPSVIRVYLDLLLECSNPETLEGAAGALQNLTACNWEPAQTIRETVRKEKGLSVITSLLRLPNDPVVRATAFCLRNLAMDPKNKELLGKHATPDLVKRLPGGEGAAGITDMTICGVVSAVAEIVAESTENARIFKDNDGVHRLIEIARAHDAYTKHCVYTANKILSSFWEIKDIKKILKALGWNLSCFTRLQTLDKSDGMEFDETRNQFRISEHDHITSPDPTFDSHTFDRHQNSATPTDHSVFKQSGSHHSSYHSQQYRHHTNSGFDGFEDCYPENTLTQSSNRTSFKEDQPPELPPRGNRNHNKSYTVADSWV